jgi:capsular exopolysaccharide synthesis family protein
MERMLHLVWRRRWAFLLAFAVTLAAAALVTFSLPRQYETEAYVLITPGGQEPGSIDITQTSEVLTNTYAQVMKTREVASAVALRLPFRATAADVESAVEIAPVRDSQLIGITATARSPLRAQALANTYGAVFVAKVRVLGRSDRSLSRATLVGPAAPISSPSRPRPTLYLLIGAFLALCGGLLMVLLRETLDRRISVDPETTEVFGLPVIARIPERSPRRYAGRRNGGQAAAREDHAEAFRLLLANLAFVNDGVRPRTVAIVSPGVSEGKSTCAVRIAEAAGELGTHAAVVDADLRRPSIADMLEVEVGSAPGLSGFLDNNEPLTIEDVRVATESAYLHIVPAGRPPSNPAALLGSPALSIFQREIRAAFQLTIYDTPPMSIGADASLVAGMVEGVVLVVDVRKTRRTAVRRALDQLQRSQANVLGIVLNRVRVAEDYSYYGYYLESAGRGERSGRRAAFLADLEERHPA